MICIETRTVLSTEENDLRKEFSVGSGMGPMFWLTVAVAMSGLSGILYPWLAVVRFLFHLPKIVDWLYWSIILSIGPIISVLLLLFFSCWDKVSRARTLALLLKAPVTEIHCQSNSVIKVKLKDNSTNCFFVDLGSDQVLFLRGNYLQEALQEAGRENDFPCTSFTIAYSGFQQRLLRLDLSGMPITPLRTIHLSDKQSLPENLQILPTPIEAVESYLTTVR